MGEMMIRSQENENPRNESISYQESIITSNCIPTWKLYENPFYSTISKSLQEEEEEEEQTHKQIHRLHLPISARKVATSFWDQLFIRHTFMESESEISQARILDLKAELEYERRSRKKMESMNKRLLKELSEERKGRESLEKVCEELAKEISLNKEEISRMRKEMEEERKMLRVAEVLREERVQMKLAEAKILLEEKWFEWEAKKETPNHVIVFRTEDPSAVAADSSSSAKGILTRSLSVEKSSCCSGDRSGNFHSLPIPRRASLPEPENPHIKHGIKGFVEFPKVIKTIRLRNGHLGTKLECRKAQLKIVLMKQKNAIRSNSLIIS